MGAGKSTVGPSLADKLSVPFIDLDSEIEAMTGYTITETIFNKGEIFFRKLEREKLEEVLARPGFVLATGGGTPCYYDNIDLINQQSLSVYLQYSVPELYARLEGRQADRPLLAHLEGEGLREFIGKHLFERAPFYKKSILVVRAAAKSSKQIINEITDVIHE